MAAVIAGGNPAAQLAAIPSLTGEGASAFQYKTTGSITTGGLTIPNRIGHRRTLVDVFFEPVTAGIFLQIQIGDRIYTRLPTQLGDYTPSLIGNAGVQAVAPDNVKPVYRGLLWWLSQRIPFDFPTAAQDESIIITPQTVLTGYGTLPAAYTISALYKDQDSGDVISKIVAGGSSNPRRFYINDMTNSLAQPTTGRNLLDTPLQPSGLNGIADNFKQIAGLKFSGYAFLFDASAVGITLGFNANGKPTRLHIIDVDTEVFTVEDQAGILVDRNQANVLAFDIATQTAFIPDTPYVFHQNRNFRFQLDTAQKAGTGTNYAAQTQYFGMIGIREPE
jgi:hypothetical protein